MSGSRAKWRRRILRLAEQGDPYALTIAVTCCQNSSDYERLLKRDRACRERRDQRRHGWLPLDFPGAPVSTGLDEDTKKRLRKEYKELTEL